MSGKAVAEFDEADKLLQELDGVLRGEVAVIVAAEKKVANQTLWLFALAVLVTVAVVVPLTLLNMFSICRPLADARRLAGVEGDAATLSRHPAVVAHAAESLRRHNATAGGQSRRVAALRLQVSPPGGDEIADKGYINQREVLRRRAEEVAALYRDEAILPAAD